MVHSYQSAGPSHPGPRSSTQVLPAVPTPCAPAHPGPEVRVMKVLVVYESMFGNTATVARAIAEGCSDAGALVALHHVSEVDPHTVDDYDLVVAGAPTHAWSLPRPSSREEAVRQGAPAASGT